MREYETIYLVKPDLPAEQISVIKEKFTQSISQGKGHLLTQGDWGKRKMAYDVDKHRYGHYIYLKYLCEGEVVHNLERLLKIEDTVLKYLTVRLRDVTNVDEVISQEHAPQEAPEEVASARADSGSRRGDSYDGGRREGGRRDNYRRDSQGDSHHGRSGDGQGDSGDSDN